jgi:hypothetical protein
MVNPMVQKKPPCRIAPTSGFLDLAFQTASVWLTISDQLVVLGNQADVILTGTPEFMFQRFTVVTGVYIAASGPFDKIGVEIPKAHRSLLQPGRGDLYFIEFRAPSHPSTPNCE